jgi:hypothetical protein
VAATGTLAIVGFLLLVVQLVLGGALNKATHDSPFALVPLVLGLVCLAAAFAWGLAKGSAAARLAVLLGLGSLILLGYAIVAIYTSYFGRPVFLAGSAALFILAITMGIRAYLDDRTTSQGSPGRE